MLNNKKKVCLKSLVFRDILLNNFKLSYCTQPLSKYICSFQILVIVVLKI